MNIEMPQIDKRGAKQIYEQAVKLAKIYCPEWNNILKDKPDEDDIGVVLLKLFSKLSETVIGQLNRIPEKHLLAFYDFIGIDHLPPAVAKAPLVFKLSKGSKEAFIPARTKIASSVDPTVVFETIESLTAVSFNIKSTYSLNPWDDKYTNHISDINGTDEGFYIFDGKDPVPHILYFSDDAFNFKTPADVVVKFFFNNYSEKFKHYFSMCSDGAGKPFSTTGDFPTVELKNVSIPKTPIDGTEGNWISFKPGITLKGVKTADLPEITKITCDIAAEGIIPDAAFFNDMPVDVKKGFHPFGETPKVGDAFYIACDEAFSRKSAKIEMTFNISFDNTKGLPSADLDLKWEYLEGTIWKPLTIDPQNYNFTATGTISFICQSVKVSTLHGIQSRWIRVRINKGDYGKPGHYELVKPIEDIVKAVPLPRTEISNIISNAKTEVINKLKGENITIPDNKIDIIFPSFKINPGIISVEFDKILLQYIEAIKNQLVKEGITSGFVYIPPSYNPPFINSLTIGYSYLDKTIQKCKTYNNFEYEDVDLNKSFEPFVPLPQKMPEFYIGFDDELSNKPLALYFPLKTRLYNDIIIKIKKPDYAGDFSLNEKAQGFAWNYYNGKDWLEFGVEDDTDFFSKSGIVKLIIPADISKETFFGKELFWIKAELKDGLWYEPPIIRDVLPNTVWAENAAVIKDELLGSSNGEGAQVFSFSSKPLLRGQMIEIKEQGIPSDDELKVIEKEEGSDALRIIKNDSGDIQEAWVRWHEVKTFVHSDSLSRHYIIDRVNGMVMFGDGIHGMIPPALPNNILAREYKSGGGKKGNQEEKTLKGLKTTIPNIDSVANYDSSSGGRDLEFIGDILIRTPHSIKNGGRAVTIEDFEWLAMEASPEVAKTRCVKDGEKIQVIIAPAGEDDRPSPEVALTDYVESYLQDRAFATVKDSIEVVGPAYKEIKIATTLVPVSISESAVVADRVERRLKEFLNPITGGEEGEGWNFGEDIYLSEVAAVIEDVEGVDYIKELKIDGKAIGEISFVKIKDNELPCAGKIFVSLIGGKD